MTACDVTGGVELQQQLPQLYADIGELTHRSKHLYSL